MAEYPEWFTTRETAEMLRIDEQTVIRWCEEGKLKGYKPLNICWYVRADQFAAGPEQVKSFLETTESISRKHK